MRWTTTSASTPGGAPSRRARRERTRASRRQELRRRLGAVVAAAALVGTATASTSPLPSAAAGEQMVAGVASSVTGAAPTSVRAAERPVAAPTLTAPAPLGSGSQVTVVDPVRLLSWTPLGPGDEVRVAVPDVPEGTSAALLNLTVSVGGRDTTVTACAADAECSLASAVPAPRNRVTPGQVVAPLVDGEVVVRNHTGDADVVVDLAGFLRAPGDDAGVVVPVDPHRVLSWQLVGERATHTLRVPDVPAGATAVVLDLGYAAATQRGYVSACAGGTALLSCARTSVLNPDPVVNRSNLAVVPLGGRGGDEVMLYNHRGSVRLNADVQAFVVPAASAQEGISATEPAVLVDETMPFGATRTVALPSVPEGATGVKLHLEAKDAVGGAAVAVCPGAEPSAACLKTSAISPYPGATTRALGYVGVADDASVTIASTSSKVDVTVRVLGYVVAPRTAAELAASAGTPDQPPATGSGSGSSSGGSSSGGSTSGGSSGSGSSSGGSSSGVKPSSSTVGVPSGMSLKRHDGDLVITKDGTVIDGLDIHGFVSIRAKNVTIRNSVVRGSGPGSYSTGLVSCLDARCSGAVVERTTLVPTTPSPWITGILGHDFTARNVDVHHVVDGFGIFDTNDPNGPVDVVIEDSWCHDLAYFANDPQQKNGPSHNDCIQIQGGSNITITGNRLDSFMSTKAGDQSYDARNRGAALMVTPNVGPVTKVVMTGNWLDGGYASASFSAGKFAPMRFGTFAENKFGRNQFDHGRGSKYPIRVKDDVTFDRPLTTNVWADGSGRLAVGRDLGIRYE